MRPDHFKAPACWIGITCLGCLASTAFGQGASVDRASEAMRREVAAKAAESTAMLARVKALPPPPPVVQGAGLFVTEEIEPDDEADENAPRRAVRVYSREAFDFYLFGPAGGADFWRTRLGVLLDTKVERIAREKRLTPAQQAKLRLAGKGDIKRLFEQIDDKRKRFQTMRRDILQAGEFLRDLQRFSVSSMREPWGDASLFSKVLDKILADRVADARRT